MSVSLKLGQLLGHTPFSNVLANARRWSKNCPGRWKLKYVSVWLWQGSLQGKKGISWALSLALQRLTPCALLTQLSQELPERWPGISTESLKKKPTKNFLFFFFYCSSNIFSFIANKEDFLEAGSVWSKENGLWSQMAVGWNVGSVPFP